MVGADTKQSYHGASHQSKLVVPSKKVAMLNEESRSWQVSASRIAPVSNSLVSTPDRWYLYMSKDVKALYWYLHFNRSDTGF